MRSDFSFKTTPSTAVFSVLYYNQIQPEYGDEQADAGRDAEPVSRDQNLRRQRGQGNIHFPCSADHVQDWQPYPVYPYS